MVNTTATTSISIMQNKIKLYSLLFIKKNQKLLLGLKTRNLGEGYWNGFGGKFKKSESIWECTARELKEECNLVVDLNDMNYIGALLHRNRLVYILTAAKYSGDIQESEEMSPIEWFSFEEIPYPNMWPDSKIWFPKMLNDDYFIAHVENDSDFIQVFNSREELEAELNKLLLS